MSLFATYGKQNFPVCVAFGLMVGQNSSSFEPTHHILFWPVVDKYSLLEISDSSVNKANQYNYLNNMSAANVAFQIQVGTVTSSVMRRGSADASLQTPFFVATILASSGTPTEIQFDNGCYGCKASSSCIDGFCAVEKKTCTARTNNCNFKVFCFFNKNGFINTLCSLMLLLLLL